MIKRIYQGLRDTFIAGLIFILPLVVLIILLSKVFQFLTGFTGKIVALFGLGEVAGISGRTIVSTISIILLCIICGYLVKVSFFRSMRNWVDQKLSANIPGYSTYREMALSKLEPKEEELPFECAVWIETNRMQQPGFLLERFPDGRLLVFVPRAGKIDEGALYRVGEDQIEYCRNLDKNAFMKAIEQNGVGFSSL